VKSPLTVAMSIKGNTISNVPFRLAIEVQGDNISVTHTTGSYSGGEYMIYFDERIKDLTITDLI
jgi:hypothetical protein